MFFNFADNRTKIAWKNITISYTSESGTRVTVMCNHKCDIYVFDNFFVIIRKTIFYTSIPIFITSDVEETKKITGFSDVYKPSKISFLQKKNKKITFEIKDIVYKNEYLFIAGNSKYFKTILSFKNLTEEQINYFEQIKDWCK
jgi:hypothetical protein